MKITDDRAHNYWRNMMNGKCYTKGTRDSMTKDKVMASRSGNYFGPDVCYFDYVANLPEGTCYVDGE